MCRHYVAYNKNLKILTLQRFRYYVAWDTNTSKYAAFKPSRGEISVDSIMTQ